MHIQRKKGNKFKSCGMKVSGKEFRYLPMMMKQIVFIGFLSSPIGIFQFQRLNEWFSEPDPKSMVHFSLAMLSSCNNFDENYLILSTCFNKKKVI